MRRSRKGSIAVEDTDHGPAILGRHVDSGEVVMTQELAIVDFEARARIPFADIAEGAVNRSGERFDPDLPYRHAATPIRVRCNIQSLNSRDGQASNVPVRAPFGRRLTDSSGPLRHDEDRLPASRGVCPYTMSCLRWSRSVFPSTAARTSFPWPGCSASDATMPAMRSRWVAIRSAKNRSLSANRPRREDRLAILRPPAIFTMRSNS